MPPLLASRLARTLNVSNEQGILNIDQLLSAEISRGARSGRRGERAPEDSLLTAGRAEPAPRARAFLSRRAASRRQTRRPPSIGGPTNCVTHDSRQEAPRYSTLIFCRIECRDHILVNLIHILGVHIEFNYYIHLNAQYQLQGCYNFSFFFEFK